MNNFDDQHGSQSTSDIPISLDQSFLAQGPVGMNSSQSTSTIPVVLSPLPMSGGIPVIPNPVLSPLNMATPPPSNARVIVTMNYVSTNTILQNVSLQLFEGHIVCLTCGNHEKAHQALRVLALEEPVVSGQLLLWNRDVLQLDEAARERIRNEHILYVRRSQLEYSNQTVRRHVAYWLHYYGEFKWIDAQEAASRALQSIGLSPNRWNVPTQDLSNEEIACVTIAKIHAVNRPRSIYLLDDIFAYPFDIASVGNLFGRLRAIVNQDKVVIIYMERQDLSIYFDRSLAL